MNTNLFKSELKKLCPGECYKADSKGHAELVANRVMDMLAMTLNEVDRLEKALAATERMWREEKAKNKETP
jgi:hypothetical protein